MTNVVKIDTYAGLMEVIDNNSTVVVDFSAPSWCVPCKRLAPHYEAAANKALDVTFVEVDIDKADDELVSTYQIQSVPTVVAYKDGEYVKDLEGRTAVTILQEVSTL